MSFERTGQQPAEVATIRAVDASGRVMRERQQTNLTDAEVGELEKARVLSDALAKELWELVFKRRVEAAGFEVDKRLVYETHGAGATGCAAQQLVRLARGNSMQRSPPLIVRPGCWGSLRIRSSLPTERRQSSSTTSSFWEAATRVRSWTSP